MGLKSQEAAKKRRTGSSDNRIKPRSKFEDGPRKKAAGEGSRRTDGKGRDAMSPGSKNRRLGKWPKKGGQSQPKQSKSRLNSAKPKVRGLDLQHLNERER